MLLEQIFDALEMNNLTFMRVLKNFSVFFRNKYGSKWNTKGTSNNDSMYFYSFLKHDKGMNQKLRQFLITIRNYNPKS